MKETSDTENLAASEYLATYKAFGSYAADTLFWQLTFLNSALLGAPNKQTVQMKLLGQGILCEPLITACYDTPPGHQLVRLIDKNNRLFIIYVERYSVRNPAAREAAMKQWLDNGSQIARLLPMLNPYWKYPEWNAMIRHQIQLLSTIANDTAQGRYVTLNTTAPLCQRLAADMADYMAAGVLFERFQQN